MQVRYLTLFQFKNYHQSSFSFQQPLICLVGANGCGKTSILDAIHFLCLTKSYFLHNDSLSVQFGKVGMRIAGTIQQDQDTHSIEMIYRENAKKEVKLNGVAYTKFSQHLGQFPCVFISPDDIQLVTESSEVRRKFLDILCSMLHSKYVVHLNAYNKILQQRNSLLKQWHTLGAEQQALLDIYNQQLITPADYIFHLRKNITEELLQKTQHIYESISGMKDSIHLAYQSTLLNNSLLHDLQQYVQKDILSQRSNYGIHKDDLIFTLNGMVFKHSASQGQRKSFIFAIKLAMHQILLEKLNKPPVLLIDDLFEKLDANRAKQLLEFVEKLNCQIFFTDTHMERMKDAFKNYQSKTQFIDSFG